MSRHQVWGIHPESDDEWKDGEPFETEEEAEEFMYSLDAIDHGLGHWEVRESDD